MSVEAPLTEQPVPAETQEPGIPTRYIVGGIIALIVLIAIIVGIVILAINYPGAMEAVRDIFIIALAIQSCMFVIILVIMLAMIARLVNMLEFEIKPILEKTNETIGMVRGTTTFVGQNVVKPVVRGSAFVAGVRRGLKVLFGDPNRNLPD